jgi:hypothetical protein
MSRKRALSVLNNAPYASRRVTQPDQDERWENVADEFPDYLVSDLGRVYNDHTGRLITPTRNSRGLAIVGLMKCGVQCKRSLALLVADKFVVNDRREGFDTPINLDGDRMNNRYTNLMLRPLWFARKYHRQFDDGHPTINRAIVDTQTEERYENSMHASVVNGVLDVEIYLSMVNNTYVWPTGQMFREDY